MSNDIELDDLVNTIILMAAGEPIAGKEPTG